jgi:arylformamidase
VTSPYPLPEGWAGLGAEGARRRLQQHRHGGGQRAQIAARNAASAAFRAAHAGQLDLAYGDAEREKWDLYPGRDAGAPCLVFIHGGYWQRNRREDFRHPRPGRARHGLVGALPGYTLAPEASLTTIAGR